VLSLDISFFCSHRAFSVPVCVYPIYFSVNLGSEGEKITRVKDTGVGAYFLEEKGRSQCMHLKYHDPELDPFTHCDKKLNSVT
jgi:hypothetical protein